MRPGELRTRAAVVLSALACIVLVGCGGSDPKAARPAPAASSVAGIAETADLLKGVPQDGLVLGDKDAPITLVEIMDLQCHFCRAHVLDVQPKIVERLVRTGRVQVHLVPVGFLGVDSQRMMVVLLRLAQTDRAWEFAHLAYWNQERTGSGYATDGWLREIVRGVPGANPDQAGVLASTTPDDQITGTAQVAAAIAQASFQQAGAGGTPFFTIGKTGTPAQLLTPILSGAPPNAYETILRAVKALEAGKEPKAFRIAPGDATGTTPTTAKGA